MMAPDSAARGARKGCRSDCQASSCHLYSNSCRRRHANSKRSTAVPCSAPQQACCWWGYAAHVQLCACTEAEAEAAAAGFVVNARAAIDPRQQRHLLIHLIDVRQPLSLTHCTQEGLLDHCLGLCLPFLWCSARRATFATCHGLSSRTLFQEDLT